MVEYDNECVGCPTGMGCLGAACPNRHVPHYYCDTCGEELGYDELHGDPDEPTGHYCDKCWKEEYGE